MTDQRKKFSKNAKPVKMNARSGLAPAIGDFKKALEAASVQDLELVCSSANS